MKTPYLWGIEESEEEVATAIRATYAPELQAANAALEEIIRGFQDFATRKQRPDNRLERARLFLATRSFNSLRMAVQTVETGYYQQAFTLVRMAMESGLVANDSEGYPPTLAALLDDKSESRIGRGDLKFSMMAERLSCKTKEVWDWDYGWASRSAAHPSSDSMMGLTTTGLDGQLMPRPGGYYDEVEIANVLYHLLRELIQLMAQIAKVTATAGIDDWCKRALPVFEEVESAWMRLDKEAGDLMQGYTECPE